MSRPVGIDLFLSALLTASVLALGCGKASPSPSTPQAPSPFASAAVVPETTNGQAPKPTPPPARTIHFPEDHPLGRLSFQDSLGWWHTLGPAMGIVQVPAGKRLQLEIDLRPTETAVEELASILSRPGGFEPNDVLAIHISKLDKEADLKHIEKLKEIDVLTFEGSWVRDEELEHLKALESLQSVNLRGSPVSDVGLRHLGDCRSLRILWLGGTKITDQGVRHLISLRSLELLDLSVTQLTDVGMVRFKELTSLTRLFLSGTQVTQEAVRMLQRSLPDCVIHSDFSSPTPTPTPRWRPVS